MRSVKTDRKLLQVFGCQVTSKSKQGDEHQYSGDEGRFNGDPENAEMIGNGNHQRDQGSWKHRFGNLTSNKVAYKEGVNSPNQRMDRNPQQSANDEFENGGTKQYSQHHKQNGWGISYDEIRQQGSQEGRDDIVRCHAEQNRQQP